MPTEIREMSLADYDGVYDVWRAAEGLCLGEDDTRDRIALYLMRNQGLCFVAVHEGKIVGTVLVGHDGRRGILRHLAVLPEHRGVGLGRRLTRASLDALAVQGIWRCNIFVMDSNHSGMKFWERLGFARLEDNYRTLQHPTGRH